MAKQKEEKKLDVEQEPGQPEEKKDQSGPEENIVVGSSDTEINELVMKVFVPDQEGKFYTARYTGTSIFYFGYKGDNYTFNPNTVVKLFLTCLSAPQVLRKIQEGVLVPLTPERSK